MEKLLVIGAGPKAAAIAAKSYAMRLHGRPAPEIHIMEAGQLCANWTGENGFTSGAQSLGTPPEKDVGFPYRTKKNTIDIVADLFIRFSWISYLTFRKQTYGEWVDRGKPHPSHTQWAQYLKWVMKNSADQIHEETELLGLEIEDGKWRATTNGSDLADRFDGVVFTGPGAPIVPPEIAVAAHDRILYGDTFWTNRKVLGQLGKTEGDDPIVIIGGGETAASVANYVVENTDGTDIPIVILTRSGTLYSRGESYYENKMFTDDKSWPRLPPEVREEVIRRGDRGVFSIDALNRISRAHNLEHRFMEIKDVIGHAREKNTVVIRGKGKSDGAIVPCQLCIIALGFDPWWFVKLLPEDVQKNFSDTTAIAKTVDVALDIPGINPRIFVPMISGLAQGPGFPNLSCLGTMSDRILGC